MQINNSPWIKQLNRTRPLSELKNKERFDVAIVGGGIAGVTTAYYTLKNTNKSVALIEAGKIAHGATGHNAGQIVSYFERQFSELVKVFGREMTSKAQEAIDSAWILLEEIYEDAKLQTAFSQFTGYAGCSALSELLVHLNNRKESIQAGINSEHLLVAREWEGLKNIPKEFDGYYAIVDQKEILNLLETENKEYIAAILARKGVMNSALFTEELLGYLLANYGDRLDVGENSPVSRVILKEDSAELVLKDRSVYAKNVVLCTNGFEKIEIVNLTGKDVDARFHHLVNGAVNYMAGYLEPFERPPTAISFLPKGEHPGEVYFYMTRRPFENDKKEKNSLICVGGPEAVLLDSRSYAKDIHPYPDEAQEQIDGFIHKNYKHAPEGKIDYKFKWHGLMGYTPNGVRCVGFEPLNKVLLYNLGCNGVGILPSIYGARRISLLLAGHKLEKTIFDPQEVIEKPYWM